MSYEPYLDCDWTEALLNPELNHLLRLSNEELTIRKTQEKQKSKSDARRNTERYFDRNQEPQKAA
jgi:hypothetical protein